MDFEIAELLIVPAVTVIMQAAKRIVAVGEDNQYVPLIAIILSAILTVVWATVQNACDPNCMLVAALRGCLFGATSVGLYEVTKMVVTR